MRPPERRIVRGESPERDLKRHLDLSLERSSLDALVLADADGLCLAAAGPASVCSEVAARLPLVARETWEYAGPLAGPGGVLEVTMRRIAVSGGDLFLCAVGRDPKTPGVLARAMRAAERILS